MYHFTLTEQKAPENNEAHRDCRLVDGFLPHFTRLELGLASSFLENFWTAVTDLSCNNETQREPEVSSCLFKTVNWYT